VGGRTDASGDRKSSLVVASRHSRFSLQGRLSSLCAAIAVIPLNQKRSQLSARYLTRVN
jgi:hypothetical protein